MSLDEGMCLTRVSTASQSLLDADGFAEPTVPHPRHDTHAPHCRPATMLPDERMPAATHWHLTARHWAVARTLPLTHPQVGLFNSMTGKPPPQPHHPHLLPSPPRLRVHPIATDSPPQPRGRSPPPIAGLTHLTPLPSAACTHPSRGRASSHPPSPSTPARRRRRGRHPARPARQRRRCGACPSR